MEELWNNVKPTKRKELLNEIYGNTCDYMMTYTWNQLPYGMQKRITIFFDKFNNK